MLFNFSIAVRNLFSLFLFFTNFIVGGSNILNEFYDSFIMEIINTIFDLIVVLESIEMLEERFKKLRNAIFYSFFLENFVNDKFSNKFDVAEDLLLLIF
jgi:hypothetical protein